MAWPQPAQPAPAAKGAPPIGPIVTAAAGVLTFLFSFVQIYKIDAFGEEVGWSVWTTDFAPGLFGVGTWIPLFALLAGALALLRAFGGAGMAERRLAGFSLLQVQLVALVFAVLLWLGYLVSILLSGDLFGETDTQLGLGMLLLFLGLAGGVAGTVLDLLPAKTGAAPATWPGQGAPQAPGTPQGQWPQPTPAPPSGQWQPGADQADPGPWAQPTPAPPSGQWQAAPPADPGQWQQPAPPPAPGQWEQPAPPPPPVPGQWQPDPAAPAPGAADPQPWSPGPAPAPAPPGPQPEPGPLDPQPAPPQPSPAPATGGGALIDPGTQVIPGPPPAPPSDDPAAADAPTAAPPPPPPAEPEAPAPQPGFPEPPPSNTP
ncbi:hypothetical protein PO878_01795 [Iamia majanohamensis]|uniref:Uncharacterized protein n=1 Tax=Iamia majanohamensis TaxID=467976 RepID=A0AAF0BW59_9ACTN|nr:hypothetical protein [Iamia majanohamensis]WCO67450.1 hypothetical protein PO878_01795 [Iamia majanohamensis]